MFYLYYRFITWFDHIIDRWTPIMCEYAISLFEKLPADKQEWENEWWSKRGGIRETEFDA